MAVSFQFLREWVYTEYRAEPRSVHPSTAVPPEMHTETKSKN